MSVALENILLTFTRGAGLRVALSLIPPSLVAWVFFILYLQKLRQYEGEAVEGAAILGIAAIVMGILVVAWLVISCLPTLTQRLHDRLKDHLPGQPPLARPEAASCCDHHAVLPASPDQGKAMRILAQNVEQEVETVGTDISGFTGEMAQAAVRLNHVAAKTCTSANDAVGAAAEAQCNAEAVAAATEELHASIQEIASQLASTRNVAHQAVEGSCKAQDSMSQLSEATNRIGAVASMISGIAAQTNMLALNATIEASRAGEAGKGFAVVAGEVKALANQTAKATQEITTQIAAIQAVAREALDAMSSISETILQVEKGASAISVAAEEQSAATGEIARAVAIAASASQRVSDLMTDLSSEAEQACDLSDEVRKDAARITDTIGGFRQTIGRVVRSSATEVNRRQTPRFGVFMPCRLSANGQDRDAIITNLSQGGLGIAADPAAIVAGSIVTINNTELGADRRMTVVHAGKASLHLAFAPGQAIPADRLAHLSQTGAQALLKKAQSDHEAFVANVMAVLDGTSKAKAADLANHHTCRLGKWYDTVSDERILACPSYGHLAAPHKRVHDAGKRVLEAFWSNQPDKARNAAHDLKAASGEVIALLQKLAHEALG